jgi:hypothetical protein
VAVRGETNDAEMTANAHALTEIATVRTARGQNPSEKIAQQGGGATSCL